MKQLGETLRTNRESKGLKGREAAYLCQLSEGQLSSYETGRILPTAPVLLRFVDNEIITPDEIFDAIRAGVAEMKAAA